MKRAEDGIGRDERLRVAWIVPGGVDPDPRAPSMPVLRAIIEELSELHDVFVYALFEGPRSTHTFGRATVRRLDVGAYLARRSSVRLASVRGLIALSAELDRDGPFDLIHGLWATTPGMLAAVLARYRGLPSVITLSGGELVRVPEIGYGEQLSIRGQARVALTLRLARAVTAASPAMIEAARRHGVEAVRVPLGIRRPKQDRPPLARDGTRVLAIGTINRVKDHATLLRAMSIVRREIPSASLDLVGEDTLGGEVHRLARELHLEKAVRFHGFVPSSELARFYESGDVLAVSSRHEAGPIVALEAASFGLPTVGTCVGHIAEWAPEAAAAVAVGDAEGLGRTLVELLRDSDRRARLGAAAKRFAEENDARASAHAFARLYVRLTSTTLP